MCHHEFRSNILLGGDSVKSKRFGDFIKETRKSKGLRLVDLADKLSVSQPYLSNLENGKRGVPKPNTLIKYSKALDIPYSELLYQAGYIKKKTSLEFITKPNMMLFYIYFNK